MTTPIARESGLDESAPDCDLKHLRLSVKLLRPPFRA